MRRLRSLGLLIMVLACALPTGCSKKQPPPAEVENKPVDPPSTGPLQVSPSASNAKQKYDDAYLAARRLEDKRNYREALAGYEAARAILDSAEIRDAIERVSQKAGAER